MSKMSHALDCKRQQLRVFKHGIVAILCGLFAGFFLIYSVLSEIALWPVFSMPMHVAGDPALWRGAHTGPIMNAVMATALVLFYPLLNLSSSLYKRISTALVLTIWGNSVFYLARIFGPNRGLALQSDKFGAGNIFDAIATFSATLAIFTAMYALIQLLRHSRVDTHNH